MMQNQLSEVLANLAKLPALPEGWDGYSAKPPSRGSIMRMKFLIEQLWRKGVTSCLPRPSVVGGVGMTFCGDERHEIYVEVLNNGNVFVSESNGHSDSNVYQLTEAVEIGKLAMKINEISQK